MDFVIAAPAYVQAAAADLANIGSTISAANAAVATPTTAIMAAGADTVSMELAALFGVHGQMYQALSAQAALFHNQFVQLMNAGGAQYALAEAANASPLQAVGSESLAAVNAPFSAASGRPLIGNGADGAAPGAAVKDGAGGSGTPGIASASGGRVGGAGVKGGLLMGSAGAVGGLGGILSPANPALGSLNGYNGAIGGAGGAGVRGGLLFGGDGHAAIGGDGAAAITSGLAGSGNDGSATGYVGNPGLLPGLAGAGGNSGTGAAGVPAARICKAANGGEAGMSAGNGGKASLVSDGGGKGAAGGKVLIAGDGDRGGGGKSGTPAPQ
jgi:PE family